MLSQPRTQKYWEYWSIQGLKVCLDSYYILKIEEQLDNVRDRDNAFLNQLLICSELRKSAIKIISVGNYLQNLFSIVTITERFLFSFTKLDRSKVYRVKRAL